MTESRQQAQGVLARLAKGLTLRGQEVSETSQAMLEGLLSDKNLLLTAASQYADAELFAIDHAVSVAALALAIGVQMGFGKQQLVLLGRGSLLHDIGMLSVPADVVYKPGSLTGAERYEIDKHPIRGLNILEQVGQIDPFCQFIVYQEHERENGTGYPKARSKYWLADIARIVAVADVFEAIGSPRPYRDGNLAYEAMAEVVRMAGRGLLHSPTVRALLSALGLFPVGSLVRLSDSTVGRVVAVNPDRYDRPIVCRLRNAQGQAVDKTVIDLSDASAADCHVAEAVSPAVVNVDPLEGF